MPTKPNNSLSGLALMIFLLMGLTTSAMADMALVWSDEFNGTSLDHSNWTMDIGNGCPENCGWGNNELEYYRAQNVTVSDGNLILTTREESYAGYNYTSGKVHTRDKQYFLYGRIEIRAKIPTGGGMWPAFWMMPQADVYGGWASSGEIDIMESANATTEIGGAIHFGGSWPDNTHLSGSYSMGGGNFADSFHIYAVEWEPDTIRWYVDGVLYFMLSSTQWYSGGAPGNPRAPFDQDFYIILNAAIGGNYTGCLTPDCISASLPQEYLIDYVRVYQESSNIAPTVTITSPISGQNPPAGNITITATTSDEDGYVEKVEFYSGDTFLGEDTTEPFSYLWTSVPDGCYSITAKAIDDVGSFGTDTVDITVGSGCGQEPCPGTPPVLPAKIEAEDFDIGGEGVAYHDVFPGNNGGQYRLSEDVDIENCHDTGGGYSVGWISQDEWLEYTVNVPTAGEYNIETRVASLSGGGVFHMEFDGVDKTGDILVPQTNGWQTWETVSTTVTLDAGLQVMKFVATSSGFNVNYFDLQTNLSGVSSDLQPAGCSLHPCYPNPFNPMTTISFDLYESSTVNLIIYDVTGKLIKTLVTGDVASSGLHEYVWNGRDDLGRVVAAGVYFCRLDAGGSSDTVRMILVK